jgi:coenzyme F420-reducing hydrogenase delta subunit
MAETNQIIAFCCNHSGYRAADNAGRQRLAYSDQVAIVSVPCSGRISVNHIMTAFEEGAAGVMVFGCQDGSCHRIEGNKRAKDRIAEVGYRLEQMGISRDRVKFCHIGPDNARDFVAAVNEMVDTVNSLGPVFGGEK